jgi:hypothetical protein
MGNIKMGKRFGIAWQGMKFNGTLMAHLTLVRYIQTPFCARPTCPTRQSIHLSHTTTLHCPHA